MGLVVSLFKIKINEISNPCYRPGRLDNVLLIEDKNKHSSGYLVYEDAVSKRSSH